jgi:IclR family transcriptional regulator, mhp operon transcriptional activator
VAIPVIQPVARALAILCAVNRRHYTTLHELAQDTKLPKPTIHRILATLRDQGYVARDPDRGVYRLTSKVLLLSAGFDDRSLITEVATGLLRTITREIEWPLALGTLDGTEIVVRCSTMPYSHRAVRATTVSNRHLLIGSAMGTTYLAFCRNEERENLLGLLSRGGGEIADRARDRSYVRDLVSSVRKRGFGLREGVYSDESATMAVPVMVDDQVSGVVSMTMFRRSLNHDAMMKYPPVLRKVAEEISSRLKDRNADRLAARSVFEPGIS